MFVGATLFLAWALAVLVVFNQFSVLSYADKPLSADQVSATKSATGYTNCWVIIGGGDES